VARVIGGDDLFKLRHGLGGLALFEQVDGLIEPGLLNLCNIDRALRRRSGGPKNER
jgi:hypothetical protein